MRHFFFLLICALVTPFALRAQFGTISGEGEIVKQEISLEALTGVKLGFSGDIILTQGTPQKIVLEGQQNILDNIKREVKGGVWYVNYDKGVRNAKPVKVHITMSTLRDVAVSGSGSITSTNVFTDVRDMDIAVSGSGLINLKINATDVRAGISGSGDIILDGTASSLDIGISGSGDVDAQNLRCGSCDVAISGSGDAAVHCTDGVEASISGSGDVRHKGTSKVKASVSGSGDVIEIE